MPDKFSQETRSRMMSGIKSKGTKPEVKIRKALFHDGFRYRINVKALPGKPDIVLKMYNVVIYVHGCFWHGHDCKYFVWPKSNAEFWEKKINGNKTHDLLVRQEIASMGWRICLFWECVTRDKDYFPVAISQLETWIKGNNNFLELSI
jgi:DNA mismatch endonuclease (patch repair protein)